MDKKAIIEDQKSAITLDKLYVLGEHWQSDLKFFEDEIQFLQILMEKYFLWFIEEINIEYTRVLADKLTGLEKRRLVMEQKVQQHLSAITRQVKEKNKEISPEIAASQTELEQLWSDFMKDFRVIKKEIFRLAEEGLTFNKSNHLLG